MLKLKGIPFKRTDLFPVMQKLVVRALGFPKQTVPAMKIDGRKIQGSREIARELDRIQPEPPLFPADPEQRAAVEEAERFGDEELQHPIRQIDLVGAQEGQGAAAQLLEGAKLGIPIGLAVATAGPILALAARYQRGHRRERARATSRPCRACSQRVDDLIAAGVLDGEQLNAADFQIAPSLRLAMTMQDLRPAIDARPGGQVRTPRHPRLRRGRPAGPPPPGCSRCAAARGSDGGAGHRPDKRRASPPF